MIEAKLKVKLTILSNDKNPFYGKRTHTKVVEETIKMDFDKRKDIAPFGIKGVIEIKRINSTDIFEINVDKHYLDTDVLPNSYHCFFVIDGKIYELSLGIKNEQVADLTLCEWSSPSEFENGEDATFYYYKDDFKMYNIMCNS